MAESLEIITGKMKQGSLGRSVAARAAAGAAVGALLAVKHAAAAAKRTTLGTGTVVGTGNIPTNR